MLEVVLAPRRPRLHAPPAALIIHPTRELLVQRAKMRSALVFTLRLVHDAASLGGQRPGTSAPLLLVIGCLPAFLSHRRTACAFKCDLPGSTTTFALFVCRRPKHFSDCICVPRSRPQSHQRSSRRTTRDSTMLGVIMTLLNPALKPVYDALYRAFLVVRLALSTSSRELEFAFPRARSNFRIAHHEWHGMTDRPLHPRPLDPTAGGGDEPGA